MINKVVELSDKFVLNGTRRSENTKIHVKFTIQSDSGAMCQRSEKIMDLSMDQCNDGKHNIVLQTIQPPSSASSATETTNETNGKRSPAVALSPSSIILSPCSDNETPNNGINSADEEFDEIKQFFDQKMHIIEKWIRERAPPDIQTKLHEATELTPKSPNANRTSSVTSDLFQQWLASSPIQVCTNNFFAFFPLNRTIV